MAHADPHRDPLAMSWRGGAPPISEIPFPPFQDLDERHAHTLEVAASLNSAHTHQEQLGERMRQPFKQRLGEVMRRAWTQDPLDLDSGFDDFDTKLGMQTTTFSSRPDGFEDIRDSGGTLASVSGSMALGSVVGSAVSRSCDIGEEISMWSDFDVGPTSSWSLFPSSGHQFFSATAPIIAPDRPSSASRPSRTTEVPPATTPPQLTPRGSACGDRDCSRSPARPRFSSPGNDAFATSTPTRLPDRIGVCSSMTSREEVAPVSAPPQFNAMASPRNRGREDPVASKSPARRTPERLQSEWWETLPQEPSVASCSISPVTRNQHAAPQHASNFKIEQHPVDVLLCNRSDVDLVGVPHSRLERRRPQNSGPSLDLPLLAGVSSGGSTASRQKSEPTLRSHYAETIKFGNTSKQVAAESKDTSVCRHEFGEVVGTLNEVEEVSDWYPAVASSQRRRTLDTGGGGLEEPMPLPPRFLETTAWAARPTRRTSDEQSRGVRKLDSLPPDRWHRDAEAQVPSPPSRTPPEKLPAKKDSLMVEPLGQAPQQRGNTELSRPVPHAMEAQLLAEAAALRRENAEMRQQLLRFQRMPQSHSCLPVDRRAGSASHSRLPSPRTRSISPKPSHPRSISPKPSYAQGCSRASSISGRGCICSCCGQHCCGHNRQRGASQPAAARWIDERPPPSTSFERSLGPQGKQMQTLTSALQSSRRERVRGERRIGHRHRSRGATRG